MSKQRLAIASRSDVFKQIDQERLYQSQRWPLDGLYDACEVDSTLPSTSVRKERLRSLGTWLGLMGEYLAKANELSRRNPSGVLEVVREVAALAVGCLEQHGVPPRSQVDFNKVAVAMREASKVEAEERRQLEAKKILEENKVDREKTISEAEVKDKAKAEVTASLEKERLEARDRAKRMIDRWVMNEKITPDQRQDELVRAYTEIDRCHKEQLAESLLDVENAGTDKCNCEVCQLRKLVERVVLGK